MKHRANTTECAPASMHCTQEEWFCIHGVIAVKIILCLDFFISFTCLYETENFWVKSCDVCERFHRCQTSVCPAWSLWKMQNHHPRSSRNRLIISNGCANIVSERWNIFYVHSQKGNKTILFMCVLTLVVQKYFVTILPCCKPYQLTVMLCYTQFAFVCNYRDHKFPVSKSFL